MSTILKGNTQERRIERERSERFTSMLRAVWTAQQLLGEIPLGHLNPRYEPAQDPRFKAYAVLTRAIEAANKPFVKETEEINNN